MTPVFETERLLIRGWIPEHDAEQAFAIYGDPEVTYFLKTRETSIESQRQSLMRIVETYSRLNNGTGYWAIVDKATTTIVGSIILKQLPNNEGLPKKWV